MNDGVGLQELEGAAQVLGLSQSDISCAARFAGSLAVPIASDRYACERCAELVAAVVPAL